MDCRQCRESLQVVLQGQLPSDMRQQFENHLTLCPECRRETARERRLYYLLQAWPNPDPDPAFADRLEKRIAEERRRSRLWISRWLAALPWQWVYIGTALVLVAGVLFLATVFRR